MTPARIARILLTLAAVGSAGGVAVIGCVMAVETVHAWLVEHAQDGWGD